mmetsp:Transcript_102441/g.290117  ORF Transcript_102441/g.290117 Transcript_102441/m.290117 type:complete len:170 (+) Transcript_102441:94-603(+)
MAPTANQTVWGWLRPRGMGAGSTPTVFGLFFDQVGGDQPYDPSMMTPDSISSAELYSLLTSSNPTPNLPTPNLPTPGPWTEALASGPHGGPRAPDGGKQTPQPPPKPAGDQCERAGPPGAVGGGVVVARLAGQLAKVRLYLRGVLRGKTSQQQAGAAAGGLAGGEVLAI